jgi:hypothetical protein
MTSDCVYVWLWCLKGVDKQIAVENGNGGSKHCEFSVYDGLKVNAGKSLLS